MARKIPASDAPSGPTRPGPLTWATLVGVLAVAVVTAGNYQQMKKLETRLDARFADLDARLGQVQAQAAQAAQRAQQQQQQRRGPDPNKVYALSDAGAPVKGSPGAPVTIFEVSDFQ